MQDTPMPAQQRKGTTTIGLKCSDGVVLGSEKRATMGYLIANKETKKVFRIQNYLGITTAGGVADAQKLVRILQVETSLFNIERGHRMKVDAVVTLLSNILHANKWYPYYVQLLMGGMDTEPKLYSLDALGSAMEEKAVSTGSGSPFAYGVLEDAFQEGMSVEEAIPIAERALTSAMSRDAMSGNGIDIITITKEGYKQVRSPSK